jgi:hypothetical protein
MSSILPECTSACRHKKNTLFSVFGGELVQDFLTHIKATRPIDTEVGYLFVIEVPDYQVQRSRPTGEDDAGGLSALLKMGFPGYLLVAWRSFFKSIIS